MCTPAVCMDDVVRSRFNGLGTIADQGLVPMDAEGHADAEAGAEAGHRLAEAYLIHLEETVVQDEMRLQSGNMLGHMVGLTRGLKFRVATTRLQAILHCAWGTDVGSQLLLSAVCSLFVPPFADGFAAAMDCSNEPLDQQPELQQREGRDGQDYDLPRA